MGLIMRRGGLIVDPSSGPDNNIVLTNNDILPWLTAIIGNDYDSTPFTFYDFFLLFENYPCLYDLLFHKKEFKKLQSCIIGRYGKYNNFNKIPFYFEVKHWSSFDTSNSFLNPDNRMIYNRGGVSIQLYDDNGYDYLGVSPDDTLEVIEARRVFGNSNGRYPLFALVPAFIKFTDDEIFHVNTVYRDGIIIKEDGCYVTLIEFIVEMVEFFIVSYGGFPF